MKIEKDNSISIDGFQEGIGQSPLSEFSDMMGIDLKYPGVAAVNNKFEEFTSRNTDRDIQEFTINTSTNEITVSNYADIKGRLIGRPFKVSSTGTLPAGLVADTIYFAATGTGKVFKVATEYKNIQSTTYIDITSVGSGVHTIEFINIEKIISWTYNSFGNIMLMSTNYGDNDNYLWQINYASDFPVLVPGNSQSGSVNGIVNYKGYTLIFRSNGVDALKDESSWSFATPDWKNDFDTVTISGSGYIKPFYSLNDDTIYFYNGSQSRRYFKIGLLEENDGQTFDPDTTSTFSFVEDVLTIPHENFDASPTVINELDEYLMVGTGGNKIYLWDKKSPSFTSFIPLKHSQIVGIEILDGNAYCITKEGVIYVTNLTTSQFLTEIPNHLKPFNYENYANSYTRVTAVTSYKEKILMGVNIDRGGAFPDSKESMYLFEYNTNTGKLTKRNITSFGEITSRFNQSEISSIFVDIFSGYGDIIYMGTTYYDNYYFDYRLESNVMRRDYSRGSSRFVGYNNYEAYAMTGLTPYGSVYNKKTLRNIEVSFMRPLSKGQGVKLYYRRDDNSDFTLWKTIDFTTYGAVKEVKVEAPLTDIKDLQVRVNLSCYNGESSGNTYYSPTFITPLLKSIRITP